MRTHENHLRPVVTNLIRRLCSGVRHQFGGSGRRPRTSARPVLEGLETRQVLTGLSASSAAVLCNVVAAKVALPVLAQFNEVARAYDVNTAANLVNSELSTQSLGNFLNKNRLGALAATPGATTLLRNDIYIDMFEDMLALTRKTATVPTSISTYSVTGAPTGLGFFTDLSFLNGLSTRTGGSGMGNTGYTPNQLLNMGGNYISPDRTFDPNSIGNGFGL
jgi:hypothetical protein